MTYIEVVNNYIEKQRLREPIYVHNIAEQLAATFDVDRKKAAAIASNSIKRLLDRGSIPELRFYKKGIFYRAFVTNAGEFGIDKKKLVYDKYIAGDNGYETGYAITNRLGLTTQLPRETIIVSNNSFSCTRKDKELDIIVKPPKAKITSDNKKYFWVLDAIELIMVTPIDTEKDPYLVLNNYMDENKLQYKELLAMADKYYYKKTVLQIAKIAGGKS